MSTWKVNAIVYESVSGRLELYVTCDDYEQRDVNKLLNIMGKLGIVTAWNPKITSHPSVAGLLSVFLYTKLKPKMLKAYINLSSDKLEYDLTRWLNRQLNKKKKSKLS